MRTICTALFTLLALLSINVSGQGLLKKMEGFKSKLNSLDNKYREAWIPFPQDNYHIKSISCAYGNVTVYSLDFVYNENGLLSAIDLYVISPKSGNKSFFQRVKDISYSNSTKEVEVKEYSFKKNSSDVLRYVYYKMDKGKIVASTSSSKPLGNPIPYSERYTYNDAGKPTLPGSKFSDKNLLVQDTLTYNGAFIKTIIDYDANNPLLLTRVIEMRGQTSDTVERRDLTKVIKTSMGDEAVIANMFKKEKEVLIVSRDALNRITNVTDNLQERLLKATIEYEERTSNEKLFCFRYKNPTDMYQYGNAAFLYNIPFYLFYFGD